MESSRRPGPLSLARIAFLALALTVTACRGESREPSSDAPKPPATSQAASQPGAPEAQAVDSPEKHAQLVNELAESRKQAQAKREPLDPEVEKRMKDPEFRKQKDAMLSKLSEINMEYFQEGIEIRHTRKRPEWRLIDPELATIKDAALRKKKATELATRFKREVEPILEKTIAVKVYADASESIEVY